MIRILTGLLVLGLANAASAATFTYENTNAGPQTDDGITVSFAAPLSGQNVGYYTGLGIDAEEGVGIDSGGFFSSNALAQGELLRINFSTTVQLAAIRLGQWQVSESVTFTANNGNSVTWNTESAAFSSYETVNLSSLGNLDYIDFTANTGTTWATINQIQGVSAVPLPAAAWLFGSALMGLMGVARRRKA